MPDHRRPTVSARAVSSAGLARWRGRRGTGSGAAQVAAHLATFLLVTFVAVYRIGRPDAASDEYAYRHCGLLYVRSGHMLCNTAHPPLAKELIGVGVVLFGNTVTTARLVAAGAAVATALFCYLFVRDVAGWGFGLAGAALWGLLPQAGVENGVTLEAIRIDRFGLVDPFMACGLAAAIFFGWRWLSRGGAGWAALAGAATAASACSKVPGMFAVPVVLGMPLVVRLRRDWRHALVEAAAGAGGVVVVVIACYAPFGIHGAETAIRKMVSFQAAHAASGTLSSYGHHFYRHAPWWSDLGYAVEGLGWPVTFGLAAALLAGIAGRPGPALFAAGTSLSVWGLLTGVTNLSLPYYWIDWEPGVVMAAAVGLSVLWRRAPGHVARLRLLAGAAVAVPLLGGAVATTVAVATAGIGPYQEAALAIRCTACNVLYVADGTILANYLSPHNTWQARPAPAGYVLSTKRGNLRVPAPGHRSSVPEPAYVVIDPASDLAAYLFSSEAKAFERVAARVGYVRVPVRGRLLVWRLRSYHPPSRRSG